MSLTKKINSLLKKYQSKPGRSVSKIEINAKDAWDIFLTFDLNDHQLTIQNISSEHLDKLIYFKNELSNHSRELFCPYPWDDGVRLEKALQQAIAKAQQKIDASYIIMKDDQPIAHFFLWKAGGNPHSMQQGVNISELGVAVADEFQGLGLGMLSVKLLQAIALSLESDAIELTTAMSNDAGWHAYLKAGFEYTGDIRNPLEVDVTEAMAGGTTADKYRTERQMIYIINQDKKLDILKYLASKRETFDK